MQNIYAVLFNLIPSAFFSIRQPHSFQSAISYPLPPPSTLKGLLANAMQQYTKVNPIKALTEVESKILVCSARSDSPLTLSLCTLRLRVFDKSEWKKDALPRQFAFGRKVTCAAVSSDKDYLEVLSKALNNSILYLGDSESLVTVSEVEIVLADQIQARTGEIVEINTYSPFDLFKRINGEAIIYWVFEETRTQRTQRQYIFPLKMSGKILYPTLITGELKEKSTILQAMDMRMLSNLAF
jgi:CRISPR-associated protein Cas5 subtype I-A